MSNDPLVHILMYLLKGEHIAFNILFEAFFGIVSIFFFNHLVQMKFSLYNVFMSMILGLAWGYWTPVVIVTIIILVFIYHKFKNRKEKNSDNENKDENGKS